MLEDDNLANKATGDIFALLAIEALSYF